MGGWVDGWAEEWVDGWMGLRVGFINIKRYESLTDIVIVHIYTTLCPWVFAAV
jgi:hypothetical protein